MTLDFDAQAQFLKKIKCDLHVAAIQGVAFTTNIAQLRPNFLKKISPFS
jgi:hypothetical protein